MDWLTWVLGAAAAAVIGIVLQVVLVAFVKGYSDLFYRFVRRLRFRFSRKPTGSNELRPKPAVAIPDYFREAVEGRDNLDLAIFDLSLRPKIPLMDLLYFEYLKQRLKAGSLRRALIVPWSGQGNSEAVQAGERELIQNLELVFGSLWTSERIQVVTSRDLEALSAELLDEDFLASLSSLGDSQFLAQGSRVMGYRFKSYHDINAGRPEPIQARSMVEHAIRGWLTFQFVRAGELERGDAGSIGALMWERELSKLLLLRNIKRVAPHIDVALLMGKSVTYRTGLKKRPLPTFEADLAVEVFAPPDQLLDKCRSKLVAELAVTNEVVWRILDINEYANADAQLFVSPDGSTEKRGPRQAEATHAALVRLHRMYGYSVDP
jgi:hypothetical protein